MSEEEDKLFEFAKTAMAEEPAKPRGRPRKAKPVLGESLLSAEDHAALKEEAEKLVADDYKRAERQKQLKKYMAEARGAYDPEEETRDVLIDLPGHSAAVTINGFPYQHGGRYTVTVSLFRVLCETMARAWQHEDNVRMANRDRYFRPSERSPFLRPGMENSPAEHILRV